MKIEFVQYGQSIVLDWEQAPRVGDEVDLTQSGLTSAPRGSPIGEHLPLGEVVSVTWWRDGSARVRLR